MRGTVIVSSLLGLRDGGHFDAYLPKLTPLHRDAIPQVVAGEWVPIELAMAHYRACDALGLPVVKLGPKEARVEVVALPVLGIPWSRHGWRGLFTANMERFCERCYATEVGASSTSVAYRLMWV